MLTQVEPWRVVETIFLIFVAHNVILSLPRLVLSTNLVITDEEGKKLPDIIGPLNEGSHLSLVCETNGEVPSVVTWWRGSSLLDDSFVAMPQGVIRNELRLSHLHRNDLMTAFTCQAAVPNFTQPSETSVSVDLNLKPLDVHITTLQRPLSSGREVDLVCQSRGSRPSALLTWWIGSQQLLQTKNTSFNGISASTISYIPIMEDNGRVLSCRASNPVLDGSILEDHRVLDVYYVPQLVVTVGTPQPNIKEGDDVYFDCNIQANPAVTEVGWRYNRKSVYTHLSAGIKVNNQSLLLRHVTKKNAGNYSCVAANVEGEGVSENVILDVQYVPFCQPDQKISYGVPLHESVEVLCSVEANPDIVSFLWYLNSSIAQTPIKHFTTNGTQSTVLFTPKRKTDYGYLICGAQNSVGFQRELCCFKISPASVPDAVQNCEVTNETTTSVSICCEPGDDGGLPQKFHFELFSTRGLHAALSGQDYPTFEITDLPPSISYIAVVFATNSRGRSNSVALTARTQPYPGPQADSKQIVVSPVLAALIVIIGLLVLIALVVVIGVRHREPDSSNERVQETPVNPFSYECPSSGGEMKPGQYI